MNVAVIGTGYVGLVSGVCLASIGHNVIGIDIDAPKVRDLNAGIPGIFEHGLGELLVDQLAEGRISFSTEIGDVSDAEILLICVGTPQSETGKADLSDVYTVVKEAAPHLRMGAILVTKSTVPVGTGATIAAILAEMGREDVGTASNPEFLRQGQSVEDFLHPDRVVIGADDEGTLARVVAMYSASSEDGTTIVETDIKTSELVKYAANAFLAIKLAYVNEIADLCETIGASVGDVTFAVGLDRRIASSYMNPGPGFGGSCLPKDTQSLLHIFAQSSTRNRMVSAAVEANHSRRESLADRVVESIGHMPNRVAVWGLTFKAGTDDLRESPAIDLIRGLNRLGVEIVVYDPLAKEMPLGVSATMAESAVASASGSDAVVVVTEWSEFRDVDFVALAQEMAGTAVVDLRNLLDSDALNMAGLDHFPIGRPISPARIETESPK